MSEASDTGEPGSGAIEHVTATTTAADAPTIAFDALPTTAASLELNGVRCVRAIAVTARTTLEGAAVCVRIDGAPDTSWRRAIERIVIADHGAPRAIEVAADSFLIPEPLLRSANERTSLDLVATLVDANGRELAITRHRVAVLPTTHWVGTSVNTASLAAFVTPNASALVELLRDVARRLEQRTRDAAISGYLNGGAERAQRIAEACYDALAAAGIAYVLEQPSFEGSGQKVRTATDVLGDRLGNCLDVSVALAALLEACGLSPVIVLGRDHAIVGCATIDEHFADAAHDGSSRVKNRLELGELRVIEATALCARASFGEALALGEQWLAKANDEDDELVVVVDVRAARRAGYHPLPEILEREATRAGGDGASVPSSTWQVRLPADLAPRRKLASTPQQARLELWMKKLLDLTLRNRLLNDRESVGIPLASSGEEILALLENELWDEVAMRVLARGAVRELTSDDARAEISRRWLRSRLDDAELFKRATKAYRDSESSLAETGARSLYVAIGFLEYRVDGRKDAVRAPLLLVPVEMKRISRKEGFTVRAVDETVVNVALVEAMRIANGLDVGLDGELTTDEKGLDVIALLARVRRQVRDFAGATVVAEAKLGTYSFKKLPLYTEMRARGAALLGHPVVASFLDRRASDAVLATPLVSPAETERVASFASVRLPLAADSSQLAAVCSAANGATFVLQGPPGTGKSQTITNLLSECLARGKRVLFIAEKAAALEVVSDRLSSCGLSEFALDLHADHASKKAFVAQIKQAFGSLGTRAAPNARQLANVGASIDRERARLREACDALHAARDGAPSIYDAAERRIATSDGRAAIARAGLEGRLDDALPHAPTTCDIDERLAALRIVSAATKELPAGAAQRWADFAPPRVLTHEHARLVADDARSARSASTRRIEALTRLAAALGIAAPASFEAGERMLAFARTLDLDSRCAAELVELACMPDHAARLERCTSAVALVERQRTALSELDAVFDRAVLSVDHARLAGDLRAARDKFVLFRWLDVRTVRKSLARHAKSSLPTVLDALQARIAAIAAADSASKAVEPYAHEIALLSAGASELDLAAALTALSAAAQVARSVRATFPAEHASLGSPLAAAIRAGALRARIDAASAAAADESRLLGKLSEALLPPGGSLYSGADDARLRARLELVIDDAPSLPAWSAASVARARARELGLVEIAEAVLEGRLSTDVAERACETELLAGWVRARLRDTPALADAAAERVGPLRAALASAMSDYRRSAGHAVAAVSRDRANERLGRTDEPPLRDAVRVLDTIRAQTTIHRPIRRVMQTAAPALTALKPIVLASPLSAATLLPPDFPAFDLVVFDEASQIPIWDAACAISRGNASVIVGDSRQLPPTNFFDRKADATDTDAGGADGADALEPLDSLLEEAIASGIREQSLLWHYRSRDERLIEFSNRRSYEGRLQTFPAARAEDAHLGVEFRRVDGVYDRGASATNRVEAEAVVAEIRRRLLDDDARAANRSIGVVTFSEAQQTLVQDLLDEAIDADALLRERAQQARELGEAVFVKNLENVQGDERATMIFSICYGRDVSGAIHHNFGPLNLSGGERRLNVAVTRAREKVVVISSIRATELDAAKCRSSGARDLRDYLAYAELGFAPAARGSSADDAEITPSAIERKLADALARRGWIVELHVGRSRDYRVGIALAHAGEPARWLLGVELDGAFHRAAPTVIDRELVRDAVLSGNGGLGWRLVRVSVLDVLRDFDATVERIDRAAREPSR